MPRANGRITGNFGPSNDRSAGNSISGGRDGFALADWATAGSGKPLSFFKDKTAALAGRRFHGKFSWMDRAGNMLKVIENLLFSNAHDLG